MITVNSERLGRDVTDAMVADARKAGLSEKGIAAMQAGNAGAYKRELDALAIRKPGNVWACTDGYTLWFNTANATARAADYSRIAAQLGRVGGSSRSAAKVAAARANGAKGGRPRKTPEPYGVVEF